MTGTEELFFTVNKSDKKTQTQKAHKYTCLARSELCTGNYDLYVLVFFVLGVRGDSAHLPLSDIRSLTGVDGGGAESLR